MIIGFTGTRRGMSPGQRIQLVRVLRWLGTPLEAYHGGAEGADTEFDQIARDVCGIESVIHRLAPGESPLVRDRLIVSLVDALIAAPATDVEELRSGTWATVRYARKAVRPVIMLSRGATGVKWTPVQKGPRR